MPSLLLSLALLCLSLHACHGGRQIGIPSQNSDAIKDCAKKVEVHDQPLIGAGGKNEGAIEVIPRKIGDNQDAIQGRSSSILSSSHVGLSAVTKELEGNDRRPEEGKVAVAREERRESVKTDVEGDVLSMDYEPPHRKPPIHN